MSVSALNNSVAAYTVKPSSVIKGPAATATSAATATHSTAPAATVSIASKTTAPPSATPTQSATPAAVTVPAPKIDPVKLAIKESNEPLPVLTKQAKHGDVVAKLLLKQITSKQAAKQVQSSPRRGATEPGGPEESDATSSNHSAERIGDAASQAAERAVGSAESSTGGTLDQLA